MSTTWIRVAYGLVLGVVLLFSIASGVAMALPGPNPPQQPDVTFRQLTGGSDNEASQNRLTAAIDKYYADAGDYRDSYVTYQRNLFLAAVALAAVIGAVGVALPGAVNYLRWGLLMGAGFALLWAGWAATSAIPDPAPSANSVLALVGAGEPQGLDFAGRFLRFAVSFVSLIILLFLGLWRLTEWPAPKAQVAATPTPPVPPAAWAAPAPPPASVAPLSATPRPVTTHTETPITATTAPVVGDPPTSTDTARNPHWGRPADGERDPAADSPT